MLAKRPSAVSNLRLLRMLSGLSQDELGQEIGLSGSYVSRIERGLVDLPPKVRVDVIRVLGEAALSERPMRLAPEVESAGQDR